MHIWKYLSSCDQSVAVKTNWPLRMNKFSCQPLTSYSSYIFLKISKFFHRLSSKFAIKSSIEIAPHLTRVTTPHFCSILYLWHQWFFALPHSLPFCIRKALTRRRTAESRQQLLQSKTVLTEAVCWCKTWEDVKILNLCSCIATIHSQTTMQRHPQQSVLAHAVFKHAAASIVTQLGKNIYNTMHTYTVMQMKIYFIQRKKHNITNTRTHTQQQQSLLQTLIQITTD